VSYEGTANAFARYAITAVTPPNALLTRRLSRGTSTTSSQHPQRAPRRAGARAARAQHIGAGLHRTHRTHIAHIIALTRASSAHKTAAPPPHTAACTRARTAYERQGKNRQLPSIFSPSGRLRCAWERTPKCPQALRGMCGHLTCASGAAVTRPQCMRCWRISEHIHTSAQSQRLATDMCAAARSTDMSDARLLCGCWPGALRRALQGAAPLVWRGAGMTNATCAFPQGKRVRAGAARPWVCSSPRVRARCTHALAALVLCRSARAGAQCRVPRRTLCGDELRSVLSAAARVRGAASNACCHLPVPPPPLLPPLSPLFLTCKSRLTRARTSRRSPRVC
jgi:hypothetical protein